MEGCAATAFPNVKLQKGKPGTKTARHTALDLLARREHSLAELREKLTAREFDPAEIEDALAALVREGLADNDRFCETVHRRPYPPGPGTH